jgi:hypothetical protein
MGILRFQLPDRLSAEESRDLTLASIAGGYDNAPAVTHAAVEAGQLVLSRDSTESGYVQVPWDVPGVGHVVAASATLAERHDPYDLLLELARGKVNQLRSQAADWAFSGIEPSPALHDELRAVSRRFATAATEPDAAAAREAARLTLAAAGAAASQLVAEYTGHLMQARHARLPKLETALGVRLNGSVPPAASPAVTAALNSAVLPLTWRTVEPTESNYRWEMADTALAWAERNGLRVTAGPLIDFSPRGLPDWLWLWEGDLQSLASFMCDYVETAVGRYRGRIRRWQLSAAANLGAVLKLAEDDFLWLSARLAEAAWQVDSGLELTIGLAQPWGDELARREFNYSPFIFADTLIRAGLKLAAIDLEWFAGYRPRGSYCRDVLDASRLLDLTAHLGVPVQVTLAYPAAAGSDALADPALGVGAGHWAGGYSIESQADWAESFARLALSKAYVRAVNWAHLTDGEDHVLPHAGLLDPAGRPRPALERLRHLREAHLR